MNMAMTFATRVCPDGYIATSVGYFGGSKQVNNVSISAGMLFSDIGAIDHEDDCAHFISCCLGQTSCNLTVGSTTATFQGGGFNIPSPFKPVYGQTHAGRLAGALVTLGAQIISPQFMINDSTALNNAILGSLSPGDVLIYATKDDVDHYEHSAILVTPTQICCHTRSRQAEEYSTVYHPWATLLKMPY
jgi:hypothetical protein